MRWRAGGHRPRGEHDAHRRLARALLPQARGPARRQVVPAAVPAAVPQGRPGHAGHDRRSAGQPPRPERATPPGPGRGGDTLEVPGVPVPCREGAQVLEGRVPGRREPGPQRHRRAARGGPARQCHAGGTGSGLELLHLRGAVTPGRVPGGVAQVSQGAAAGQLLRGDPGRRARAPLRGETLERQLPHVPGRVPQSDRSRGGARSRGRPGPPPAPGRRRRVPQPPRRPRHALHAEAALPEQLGPGAVPKRRVRQRVGHFRPHDQPQGIR
mmetsp:Transcript_16106/g.45629  ORF Transcript_16106/g.45629 Transcript_16106/m.45629 type:complete len:269 (+) Transcript_16106:453-1259(+)